MSCLKRSGGEYVKIYANVKTYQEILTRLCIMLEEQSINDYISRQDCMLAHEDLDALAVSINEVFNMVVLGVDIDELLVKLQEINVSLSVFMKCYGSSTLDDLLHVCLGTPYLTKINNNAHYRDCISRFIKPLGYKVISHDHVKVSRTKKGSIGKGGILEDINIADTSKTLDIFDMTKFKRETFNLKLNGIKVVFQNEEKGECIIVHGYMSKIPVNYLLSSEVLIKKDDIYDNVPTQDAFHTPSFKLFMECLSLKELLIYSSNEIYEIFIGYKSNVKDIKQKPVAKLTREFMTGDLFEQRQYIFQMLIFSDDFELQFLSYLLYDLLSLDDKTSIDSKDQQNMYDSLPTKLKQTFRNAMKETIEYTLKLSNGDIHNNLPLEQRICLLKTNENVKEKAMVKVKELKSKTEDSGSKARQYLDGLLKIPFGIFRTEPIFNVMGHNIANFDKFLKSDIYDKSIYEIPIKDEYNPTEIMVHSKIYRDKYIELQTKQAMVKELHDRVMCLTNKSILLEILSDIGILNSDVGGSLHIPYYADTYSSKELSDVLINVIELNEKHKGMIDDIVEKQLSKYKTDYEIPFIQDIVKSSNEVSSYFTDVRKSLDDAVYGHKEAKFQIERIVGQWINGKMSGYCFGFEGPPGVGKTSMAKRGISHCLKDENGVPRPFTFIAIGGSSNGATLDGHNYTYVGSMWGKIVDVLMETKCMNPIIFIDEVDKVSRTETGREIIGILTHLVDPTQNDAFQDKYFSGIDLDLSKVLFIFSYNDVELMDRILLDRIHRIKFKHITIDEKLIICNKHMLPEILAKMGQVGNITFTDEVLVYLISTYTSEAGVRKLKEILFEIVGEINIELLRDPHLTQLPIIVTKEMISEKYLKQRYKARPKLIHTSNAVGIINGLWANAMGKGGIIQIEAKYMLSDKLFELKLTGMQGDVMKESMNVAKTLTWERIEDKDRERLLKEMDGCKTQGVHIHCPEGAVPKDGPSAGTAITVVMYSLLTRKKIRNNLAITGEINLQGCVTAIGGLDLKILGGIEAGVKTFLFPSENKEDFDNFINELENKNVIDGITFHPISSIEEALKYAIEE